MLVHAAAAEALATVLDLDGEDRARLAPRPQPDRARFAVLERVVDEVGDRTFQRRRVDGGTAERPLRFERKGGAFRGAARSLTRGDSVEPFHDVDRAATDAGQEPALQSAEVEQVIDERRRHEGDIDNAEAARAELAREVERLIGERAAEFLLRDAHRDDHIRRDARARRWRSAR